MATNPKILYKFDTANSTLNSGTLGSSYNITLATETTIDTTNVIVGTGALRVINAGKLSGVSTRTIVPSWTVPAAGVVSFSFWAKATYTASGQTLFSFTWSSGGYCQLYFGTVNDRIVISINGNDESGNYIKSGLFDGNFHNYILVVNGQSYRLAVDGVEIYRTGGTFITTSPTIANSNITGMCMGASIGNTNRNINGYIDDFRMYDYNAIETIRLYIYYFGSNTHIDNAGMMFGIPTATLVAAGATVAQLKDLGRAINEIISAGYTINELLVSYNVSELVAGGVTVSQLLATGSTFNWLDLSAASNIFNKTYVNNFVDLSGDMIIRNDSALICEGDVSMVSNLVMTNPTTTKLIINDLSLNNHLFIGGNVSIQGNVSIGGDLSINNQFSGNFADGIIPTNAIIEYPSSSGGDITITGKARTLGDVSFNGTTLEVSSGSTIKINGNLILPDQTVISSYDNNISSGTFAEANVIFKNSRFDSVVVLGAATVTGTITTASDYRIKENIEELDSLFTLDSLTPVEYDNILSGNHEYGVIAHELQATYPFLVQGEKDGPEYQQVCYTGLIGIMVNEVKQLKQKLDTLKSRI